MSRVLPARLAPTRVVPYRLGGGALLAVAAMAWVETPTRLGRQRRRVAKAGDTIVLTDILKGYDGVAQDLTGCTVRFTLVSPNGQTKLVDRALATILQDGDTDVGKVTVTVAANVGVPAGVSTFEFEVTAQDGSVLTFPDDANGELTVIAQLA